MSSSRAADALDWSLGKLSKLETGSRGTGVLDIAALLGRYAVERTARERILAIAAERDSGSFLRLHGGVPDALAALAVHERIARVIVAYDPVGVPALAQTEDYARALYGQGAVVETRMSRHRDVWKSGRRETVLYLHENVLRLRVGTSEIMRDQLLHLTLMCGWAGTSIRIVPTGCGLHSTLRNAATVLTFDEPIRPVAYTETDAATVFHDEPNVVALYRRKMAHLDRVSVGADESREVLARWANAYENEGNRPAVGHGRSPGSSGSS